MKLFFINELLNGVNRYDILKAYDYLSEEIDFILNGNEDNSLMGLYFTMQYKWLNNCSGSKDISKFLLAYCLILKCEEMRRDNKVTKNELLIILKRFCSIFYEIDSIINEYIEEYGLNE